MNKGDVVETMVTVSLMISILMQVYNVYGICLW